jgi:hypothetical protein
MSASSSAEAYVGKNSWRIEGEKTGFGTRGGLKDEKDVFPVIL